MARGRCLRPPKGHSSGADLGRPGPTAAGPESFPSRPEGPPSGPSLHVLRPPLQTRTPTHVRTLSSLTRLFPHPPSPSFHLLSPTLSLTLFSSILPPPNPRQYPLGRPAPGSPRLLEPGAASLRPVPPPAAPQQWRRACVCARAAVPPRATQALCACVRARARAYGHFHRLMSS